MRITAEMRATIAAREAVREAEYEAGAGCRERERAEKAAEIAAIELSPAQLEAAVAAGLDECEAQEAMYSFLQKPALWGSFEARVVYAGKSKREHSAELAKEAAHVARLSAQKVRRDTEDEATWLARCKKVDKRERDRLRRRNWRTTRAYYASAHGVPMPSSYSGTNRNTRRSQRSPEYYKAQEEIRELRADFAQLEYLATAIEAQRVLHKKMVRLGHEDGAFDAECDLRRSETRAADILQKYRLNDELLLPDPRLADGDMAARHDRLAEKKGRARVSRRDMIGSVRQDLEAAIRKRFCV